MTIFIASVSGGEALNFSLIASSTSADHQALGWRLTRPKAMEDLIEFSVREVKRAAAEERKRVFLCKWTEREIEIKGKVTQQAFRKLKRDICWGG